MRLSIDEEQLAAATRAGVLAPGQAGALWDFLRAEAAPVVEQQPRFKMAHLLYYFGGLLAIGAISIFMTAAWDAFGAWPLLVFGVAMGLLAYALTRRLLEVEGQPLAAGTMAALLIAAVPLSTFALQHLLGFWSGEAGYADYHRWIDWRWLMMEFATLIAGVVVLWRFRLPFAMLPVAVTLWYMSMDLAAFLAQEGEGWFSEAGWRLRATVSMLFGAAMVALALWIELRQHAQAGSRDRRDFAFWLHLVGVLTFWGGLSAQDSGSEWGKLLYAAVNVGLILVGAMLARRVYVVFGALGIMAYLSHLSYRVFADSLLFTLVLALLGIGIVFAGVWWSRHEAALHQRLVALLPPALRRAIALRSG